MTQAQSGGLSCNGRVSITRVLLPLGSDEGVLVFVIPVTALGDCARLLSSQFERLGCFGWNTRNASASSKSWYSGNGRNPMAAAIRWRADALLRAGYQVDLIPALNHQIQETLFRPAIPASNYSLHRSATGRNRGRAAAFDCNAKRAGHSRSQAAEANWPADTAAPRGKCWCDMGPS